MATYEKINVPALPQVRRMEAVSFRSFPSTSTYFDGTWVIRLTAGHPAKRLNSVNPLDPSDHGDIERRIAIAQHRFESFGRPLIFRLSPLAPPELDSVLDQGGWVRFEESIVMIADLEALETEAILDQVPVQDIGMWVDTFLELSGEAREHKPGLAEVIGAIEPEVSLFMHRDAESQAVSAVRCVCDNDLAGMFDMVTSEAFRRLGHGRSAVQSALKWAKLKGAKTAWLQVVADNQAAIGLYESLGFREIYRYSYRALPESVEMDA